ncbi:hypothetical protein ADK60_38400 [Streptomyces sp. XY431]|uniref:hypothetical protein n=1 Tax=Streptomyces sp. XY431 TaxID=1415562 RepID=UPI0006AE1D01|nr:hypothetical protein [Streptomyces sp. XY431]KOV10132.1 hypothetical protein ADK60_38400 [Streptomyces sp. XY431]
MIETTEHKATLTVRLGSVVGVRNERMHGVLALSVGAETARPARLSADQCRELAAYLARQAGELDRAAKVERVSAPEQTASGLFDRTAPASRFGVWEKR